MVDLATWTNAESSLILSNISEWYFLHSSEWMRLNDFLDFFWFLKTVFLSAFQEYLSLSSSLPEQVGILTYAKSHLHGKIWYLSMQQLHLTEIFLQTLQTILSTGIRRGLESNLSNSSLVIIGVHAARIIQDYAARINRQLPLVALVLPQQGPSAFSLPRNIPLRPQLKQVFN